MNNEIFELVSEATCAVGYLQTSVEKWKEDLHGGHLEIIGTGFIIAPDVVLTNRHVIVRLEEGRQKSSLSFDANRLLFHSTSAFNRITLTLASVKSFLIVTHEHLDLGLIYFDGSSAELRDRMPLEAATFFEAKVGDRIMCLGYPFGSRGLKRESSTGEMRSYRFGPVLQQGYISAIAPFGDAQSIDRVLLDVRTVEGMSGSPVVSPDTGRLIGIHDAGIGATMAFCTPLSQSFLEALQTVNKSAKSEAPLSWQKIDEVRIPKVRRHSGEQTSE